MWPVQFTASCSDWSSLVTASRYNMGPVVTCDMTSYRFPSHYQGAAIGLFIKQATDKQKAACIYS